MNPRARPCTKTAHPLFFSPPPPPPPLSLHEPRFNSDRGRVLKVPLPNWSSPSLFFFPLFPPFSPPPPNRPCMGEWLNERKTLQKAELPTQPLLPFPPVSLKHFESVIRAFERRVGPLPRPPSPFLSLFFFPLIKRAGKTHSIQPLLSFLGFVSELGCPLPSSPFFFSSLPFLSVKARLVLANFGGLDRSSPVRAH